MSRLYPFTSALNMAASLRCTGSDVTLDLNFSYVNFFEPAISGHRGIKDASRGNWTRQ